MHSVQPRQAKTTISHCRHGHAYTSDNTYIDKNGSKICRICQRARQKQRRALFGDKIRKYGSEWQRKKKHGVDADGFNAMYAKQDGKCMICQSVMPSKDACIDHNHETGKIRDLLCRKCNLGLGFFNDNPELLLSANSYLNKHQNVR